MSGTSKELSHRGSPDLRRTGLNPNFWYPLAEAGSLAKGRTLAVSFAGVPIVLVRTAEDMLFALEDRCAHRQVPLSYGVVGGGSLRCCYHGWTYDKQGGCTVPYLPKGAQQPSGVKTYPSREAYGLIFDFPGDSNLADTIPLPDHPECCSKAFMILRFARLVNCHYSFLHENLVDMSHQFLHRRWMGKFKPLPVAVRKGSDHVEVDCTAELTSGSFILRHLPSIILRLQRANARGAAQQMIAGHNESGRTYAGDFVTVSTQYPYQGLALRRPGLDEPLLKLWLAHVPVGNEQKISRLNVAS